MTGTRPTALVTAPFRGEGMETLQSLADVVYDPWIEQVPLRLYDGEKLAARIRGGTRRHPHRRVRLRERPRVRLRPAASSGRAAATPTTSTSPRRPRPASPCCTHRAATPTPSPRSRSHCCSRSTATSCPPTATCATGKVYAGGKIPYQRYRAWQLAGRTAGIVGLGAVGRATQWRLEGLGMRVLSYDPYNPDATHTDLDAMLPECDVVSMHAVVTPETGRPHGRRAVRAHEGRGRSTSTRARAVLHDIDALVAALQSGHLGRRRPRPLQGREPRRPTTRSRE